jgi:hypothetical protein
MAHSEQPLSAEPRQAPEHSHQGRRRRARHSAPQQPAHGEQRAAGPEHHTRQHPQRKRDKRHRREQAQQVRSSPGLPIFGRAACMGVEKVHQPQLVRAFGAPRIDRVQFVEPSLEQREHKLDRGQQRRTVLDDGKPQQPRIIGLAPANRVEQRPRAFQLQSRLTENVGPAITVTGERAMRHPEITQRHARSRGRATGGINKLLLIGSSIHVGGSEGSNGEEGDATRAGNLPVAPKLTQALH